MERFSRFLTAAALGCGQQVVFERLASDAAVPARTVREYFQVLQDTLVGELLQPFTPKRASRKPVSHAKFYLFDVGVANVLAGTSRIAAGSAAYGRALEHLVFCELSARIGYSRDARPLTFWRTTDGSEVDFVVGDSVAIEVKASGAVAWRDLVGPCGGWPRRCRCAGASWCAVNRRRGSSMASNCFRCGSFLPPCGVVGFSTSERSDRGDDGSSDVHRVSCGTMKSCRSVRASPAAGDRGYPGPEAGRPRGCCCAPRWAGLCHSDLHFMEGLYECPLPVVLGHESSAVVEQVGPEVTYVKPGDRVITCLSVFCGTCEYCTTGRPALCSNTDVKLEPGKSDRLEWDKPGRPHTFANLSSFAEQMLVHENAIVKIGDEMPLDRAALIGCGVITGFGAAVNTAKVRPGETVAVIGCGGVGMAAVNGAYVAGAGRIIAVDTNPAKLEAATKLGATDLVNAGDGDPVERIIEMTGGGVHHALGVHRP